MATQHTSIQYKTKNKIQLLVVNNDSARSEISLFGAHVLSYVNSKDKRERLWVSKAAIFDAETPIRGGIPICWPWFSAHPEMPHYPSHGYARTQNWKVEEVQERFNDDGRVIQTTLVLIPSEACLFGYTNISVYLKVVVGEQLSLELVTQNKGSVPIRLSQALHSYFQIENIRNVHISNITEHYFDKPTEQNNLQTTQPYIIDREIDRIHSLPTRSDKTVQINSINAQLGVQFITMTGADSIVVWNPWKEKSDHMKDMHQDAYTTMLCIEAANTIKAKTPLVLHSNSEHTLAQIIS